MLRRIFYLRGWKEEKDGENYEEESVNRSQMDINRKYVAFELEKKIYFSTYPPLTLIHFSHRFTSASKPAA
jgi:hypothetical protein